MNAACFSCQLSIAVLLTLARPVSGEALPAAPFDALPFGLPLPDGRGVMWEDPREVHQVVVQFQGTPPAPDQVRLEYWGSWWPGQHLPKDREPGGGDVGWLELGNWWKYDWRVADAYVTSNGNRITFTFRPVNAKEFPDAKNYPATFRYTLKLRVISDAAQSAISRLEAYTDSSLAPSALRLAWAAPPSRPPQVEAFNGVIEGLDTLSPRTFRVRLRNVVNPDPNTFDRSLVTVRNGADVFTIKVDDLAQGALFIPHYGVAVLPETDGRDYAAVASEQKARGAKTLYDRVSELPEQTWQGAWESMPPKKSFIYFPLGLDGGRQRFRLNADGSIDFRSNDHYLKGCPGKDTPRLALEKSSVSLRFGLPPKPVNRTLEEESLPICITTWNLDGVQAEQVAFVTPLEGTRPEGPTPAGDTLTVWMARLTLTNTTAEPRTATLPLEMKAGGQSLSLLADKTGVLGSGPHVHGQFVAAATPLVDQPSLRWTCRLAPGETRTAVVKIPYVVLTEGGEREALTKLEFDRERQAVAGYWRRRLDASARLITPVPMLNEFYRSHAMHLLVNCEREPGRDRRFARVGSFGYGAYGNESCMMVADLERRGYHKEAQDCLDAWLRYQGTVGLPGSFASKEGVLYGANGYEAGGYNQHHGWILWMLAEHYRFTRDQAWLVRSTSGIVNAADWIIRETARTRDRHELERGLLPAGSLEDIGDWWTWLSTSCYTWRGLDAAAWVLEEARHPEAQRIRAAAGAYRAALLDHFNQASARSPVVRLRDGTAVPKIPSQVHRRGRSFGWICETLEGAIHLLITGALDARSAQAEWILKDYEDNLYLSNQYGYTLDDFEKWWFTRGGMSMQACLLLDVEPYLYRDDVKHALRALFNAQAVSYFPDVRMNTEHALPEMGDWRGDHFKSSDESNCAGWLRYLFVREEGEALLVGQAVPREWLKPGSQCGLERTSTPFGPASVRYAGGTDQITAHLGGAGRNPPKEIRLRFREPNGRPIASLTVNGKPWTKFRGEWVDLPGDIGAAEVVAQYRR
jgi:hypothetical protein